MGLEVAGVHVVWIVAVVGLASVAAPLLLDAMDDARAGREAREAARAEALDGRAAIVRYLHDPVRDELVVEMLNAGRTPLDAGAQAFVVDGVARVDAAATIEGRADSALWLPGETARFVVPNVNATPSRVVGIEPGAAFGLASEGHRDEMGPRFVAGAGAANARRVSALAIASDEGAFSASMRGSAGVDVVVSDVVRLENPGYAAHPVQLTATRVTNTAIQAMEWRVYNGTALVATLNLKATSPNASFTLPAGESYAFAWRLDLSDSAGSHDAQGTWGMTVVAT